MKHSRTHDPTVARQGTILPVALSPFGGQLGTISRISTFIGGVASGVWTSIASTNIFEGLAIALVTSWMLYWSWRAAISTTGSLVLIDTQQCVILDLDWREVLSSSVTELDMRIGRRRATRVEFLFARQFGPPVSLWVANDHERWLAGAYHIEERPNNRFMIRRLFYILVAIIIAGLPLVCLAIRAMVLAVDCIQNSIVLCSTYIAILAAILVIRAAFRDVVRFRPAFETLYGRVRRK